MDRKFDRVWIDAGGTHVRAIGQKGTKRTKIFATSADRGAVEAAVKKARGRVTPHGDIVVGLRGVWTKAERAFWLKKLSASSGARVRVVSDIELAHALAFPNGEGIILNAGTGSIAYGRNAAGKTARAGGMGPLLGDDGSAFWIGREYLRRVERGGNEFDVLRRLAVSENPVAAIAAKSKDAIRAARRNPEAKRIVKEAQSALRRLVAEVQVKLGGKRLPLALHGGLFSNPLFLKAFSRK